MNNEENKSPSKKPYQTPSVQAYGDVKSLTQSKGRTGFADGGTVMYFMNSLV